MHGSGKAHLVVGSAERLYSVLPVPLLADQLVNLIVEVSDLELPESCCGASRGTRSIAKANDDAHPLHMFLLLNTYAPKENEWADQHTRQ
jgi:hypothetical protein